MARTHRKPTVYGGWYMPERKREGYRLRVHVCGEAEDRTFDTASLLPSKARENAQVILAREGIKLDPGFVSAFIEYWDTGVRKWVVRDVIRSIE